MKSEITKKTDVKFFFCSYIFLNSYLPLCGISKNTILSYRASLLMLTRFWEISSKKDITEFLFSDCTRDFLLNYVKWLSEEKHVKSSTISNRLAAIKSYANFAKTKDPSIIEYQIEINSVKAPKSIKIVREALPEYQIEKILAQIPNTKKGLRDKTLLTLLYETACRLSELLALEKKNIFLDNSPYIKILGKGKKERVIPISDNMKLLINNYIKNFHCDLNPDTQLLFYSIIKGSINQLTPRSVQLMLKKYADLAREQDETISTEIYPHAFRRSRATNLYNNGMDFTSVSTLMGHSRLETTRIYCKPSIEKLRNEMDKSSNKFNTNDNEDYNWQDKEEILRHFFG